ncbi:MAG: hypothetical protein QM774_00975 [Gordonia sp. (in: high G+C Gram-positive bacteria)]|uniref:hypothetical protein n=1 Tax=Gordonia sp. (in: high G+C Gram-positive bacteria) TaxID=84139 RepID=UPI0039E32107
MPVITDALDDAESLSAADRDGLLRSAAMAGAQVRAVAEAQAEGVLGPLGDLRPRAVVVVTGGSPIAARAAALVVAILGSRIDVPIAVSPALPGWIGPLDVVVVLGADAGDPHLADAASRAGRRRAEVVIAAPVEGPLREVIGDRDRGDLPILDLSPRLPVDPRFRFTGHVASLVAVLTALTAVRLTPPPPELAVLADQLDAESAADHPGLDSFTNQAKQLALRAADHACVWSGDTAGATVLAAQTASTFFSVGGVPTAAADEATGLAALTATSSAAIDSIFYDPEFDGPARDEQRRLFLITTAAREWYVRQRLGARDADVVTEQVGGESENTADAVADRVPAAEPFTDTPGDLTAYLITATRAELAAAYLALGRAAA